MRCRFMALRAAFRPLISTSPRLTLSTTLRSMSGVVVDGFRTFELAMVQLGGIQDDKKANLEHAAAMIRKASKGNGKAKADLVMLPEIFNSPMQGPAHHPNAEVIPDLAKGGALDASELPDEKTSPTLHMLSAAARECGVWLIGGSIPELPKTPEEQQHMSLNTMTVWDDQGRLVGKYSKIHLYDVNIPGGIVFQESESIKAGSKPLIVTMPFGTIALAICYDIRFPNMISAMIEANPSICAYFLPSAFNMTTGPRDWEILQRVRAIDNQIFVGMCSPARNFENEYVSYGNSLVCSPRGQIISSPTPEDQGETIVFSTIDTDLMKQARESLPLWRSQRGDVYRPPTLVS